MYQETVKKIGIAVKALPTHMQLDASVVSVEVEVLHEDAMLIAVTVDNSKGRYVDTYRYAEGELTWQSLDGVGPDSVTRDK